MLGTIGAAAAGRALSGMLFETTSHDVATYAIVAVVILFTSLVATALPAMRACAYTDGGLERVTNARGAAKAS